ncbi:putative DNA binding domain-containing protein [Nocardioides sp. LMS-CY]|uniref:ATP-binding protein n=1 Tax=Nocardioides sp. (strain LMS-CY) TaxID=2840457 RepID=UPI001C00075D|nr:ATP-binding protein [Nocardioides sp. LMS-CY]QWF22360.1 putative DNA binding domain-containing protein [Nocardioides sp. LMS-CY]
MPKWTAAEFQRLIEREDDDVELKSGASPKKLQEAMVAFTNSGGGTIFIGVNDQRVVIGRRRDQGTDDAIHEAALNGVNVGRYAISGGTVDGTPIVVVDVEPREDEVAQTSDGRVLRRRGGRNVAVFGAELWEMMTSRALRRYEASASGVPPSAVPPAIADEVAGVFGWTENLPDRWRERGLLHADGSLTIAGALTLTRPEETLGAAKFAIDVRSYESDDSNSYVRREAITGQVQAQAEAATDWILRDIGTEMVVTGAKRHDVPRLPRRVVREAVANAVAHRDYARDQTPIVVEIRPSAVIVTSPGRLPAPVTIATLREAQAPRNHTIIDVLRRFGLAEDSGQGIDVIQDGMRLELLHEPLFEETNDSFRVTLRLRGLVSTTERAWLAEHERQGRLREGDRLLLLTVMRDGQVTNARAREILGADSVEARTRLGRLRDAGLLIQHGTRGRAYYTLGVIGPDRSAEEVVLEAAQSAPLTNAIVRELTSLDRYQAGQLLRRLVNEGKLAQQGERRGTTYRLQ